MVPARRTTEPTSQHLSQTKPSCAINDTPNQRVHIQWTTTSQPQGAINVHIGVNHLGGFPNVRTGVKSNQFNIQLVGQQKVNK